MGGKLSKYTIRQLDGNDEYRACVELQKETWGDGFSECVPASILLVGQKIGGVSAGAFDTDGRLVGFVFGLTGMRDGKPVHWSDMLAVQPHARDAGLGRQLKLYQRGHCLTLGVETIYWTFDPLEAKNAHLNFNKLGANIDGYVADMYVDSDSVLHRGLAMDRFIIAWHIASERVKRALTGTSPAVWPAVEQAPVAHTRQQTGHDFVPTAADFPLADVVRVEIPADIQQLKTAAMAEAVQWRFSTRAAFLFYQQRGYEVDGFYRQPESGRCFYVLAAPHSSKA